MADDRELKSPTTNDFTLLDELKGVLKEKYIDFESDGESYSENTAENEALKELDGVVDSSEKNEIRNEKEETLKRISAVGVAIVPMTQPIIFKTSIKRDPGSKLQDELVKELNSVLSNRDGVKRTASLKESKDAHKIASYTKKPVQKPNSVRKLFDSNMLANLENHFLNRTLQRKPEKDRPSLKENSFEISKLSEESAECNNLPKESNLTRKQPVPEELSFSELKQKWIKNIKTVDSKITNENSMTSSPNNIPSDVNDLVFQYGLRNGIMYTANIKIIHKSHKHYTIISISGKNLSKLKIYIYFCYQIFRHFKILLPMPNNLLVSPLRVMGREITTNYKI